MIASSAFFVLDAILGWPVSNYDGSWSQWGQMSGDSTKGGQLRSDSPWRTDISSRSDLFIYNYDTTAGPVLYTAATGTVLNDMSAGGTFTGTANRSFRIQIDSVGSPDTFRWTKNNTATPITWETTTVPISAGTPTTLTEGMTITFTADAGHTLGDRWDFYTKRPVELLTLDGSVCSWQQKLDGTNAYSPAGCTPLSPNSYAATANQIEEEDAAYFGAGGAGGGGGGGGPVAPGY